MDLNNLLTDDEFRRFVKCKIAMEVDIETLVEYHNEVNCYSCTSIGYIHTDINKSSYYRYNDMTGEKEYIDDDYIRSRFDIDKFMELVFSRNSPFKLLLLMYKREYEGART